MQETEMWGPADGPSSDEVAIWVMIQQAGERAFQLGEMAKAELIRKSVVLPIRIYEA